MGFEPETFRLAFCWPYHWVVAAATLSQNINDKQYSIIFVFRSGSEIAG